MDIELNDQNRRLTWSLSSLSNWQRVNNTRSGNLDAEVQSAHHVPLRQSNPDPSRVCGVFRVAFLFPPRYCRRSRWAAECHSLPTTVLTSRTVSPSPHPIAKARPLNESDMSALLEILMASQSSPSFSVVAGLFRTLPKLTFAVSLQFWNEPRQ